MDNTTLPFLTELKSELEKKKKKKKENFILF